MGTSQQQSTCLTDAPTGGKGSWTQRLHPHFQVTRRQAVCGHAGLGDLWVPSQGLFLSEPSYLPPSPRSHATSHHVWNWAMTTVKEKTHSGRCLADASPGDADVGTGDNVWSWAVGGKKRHRGQPDEVSSFLFHFQPRTSLLGQLSSASDPLSCGFSKFLIFVSPRR